MNKRYKAKMLITEWLGSRCKVSNCTSLVRCLDAPTITRAKLLTLLLVSKHESINSLKIRERRSVNRPKEYPSQPCWNHKLIAAEFHKSVYTSGPGNTTPYHCRITNNTKPGVKPVQQFGTQCGTRVRAWPGWSG